MLAFKSLERKECPSERVLQPMSSMEHVVQRSIDDGRHRNLHMQHDHLDLASGRTLLKGTSFKSKRTS